MANEKPDDDSSASPSQTPSDDYAFLQDQYDELALIEQVVKQQPKLLQLIDLVPTETRASARSFAKWLDIPLDAKFLQPVLDALKPRQRLIEQLAEMEQLPVPAMLNEHGLDDALRRKRDDGDFRVCLEPSSKRNDPTMGVQTDHPFYAMHPYHPAKGEHRAAYDLLQAQVVFWALACWDETEDDYRFGVVTYLRKAVVAVRNGNNDPVLARLPAKPMTGSDYTLKLREVLNRTDLHGPLGEETRDRLDTIAKFLEKAIIDDDDDVVDDDVVELSVAPSVLIPGSDDVPFAISTRLSAPGLSLPEKKRLLNSGLAPEETASDIEHVTPEEDPDLPKPTTTPPFPPPLVVQVRSKEHLVAAIERSNQNLPAGWDRLLTTETAIFLHEVGNDATDVVDGKWCWTSDPLRLETAALLMSAYWTSRALADCVNMVIIRSLASLHGHRPPTGIGYVVAEQLWYIPVVRPKAAPRYAGADFSAAEPTADHVLLPVPPVVAMFLQRLPSVIEPGADWRWGAFSEDSEILKDRALDIQRHVIRRHPRRMTVSRPEQTVFWAMIDASGDAAEAALMVGRHHRSADTALHYALMDRPAMAERYTQTCATLLSKAQAELEQQGLFSPIAEMIQSSARLPNADPLGSLDGKVGAPICPTPSTVRRLRTEVDCAYAQAAASPGTPGHLVRHHNLLTLHTVLLLKEATGYRDIKSPLPRRDNIDFDDGTVLIRDKDTVAGFSIRVVPLVEPIRQQLIYYDLHVHTLASRVALSSPGLAKDLFRQFGLGSDPEETCSKHGKKKAAPAAAAVPGASAAPAASTKKKPAAPKEAPPLFFLDETKSGLTFLEVRPKVLGKKLNELAPWFRLPTNLNRAYLRHHLAKPDEAETPSPPADPESIAYLLSHWTRGREPLGLYATLPLDYYLKDLAPRLSEILVQDGWIALKGFS